MSADMHAVTTHRLQAQRKALEEEQAKSRKLRAKNRELLDLVESQAAEIERLKADRDPVRDASNEAFRDALKRAVSTRAQLERHQAFVADVRKIFASGIDTDSYSDLEAAFNRHGFTPDGGS